MSLCIFLLISAIPWGLHRVVFSSQFGFLKMATTIMEQFMKFYYGIGLVEKLSWDPEINKSVSRDPQLRKEKKKKKLSGS